MQLLEPIKQTPHEAAVHTMHTAESKYRVLATAQDERRRTKGGKPLLACLKTARKEQLARLSHSILLASRNAFICTVRAETGLSHLLSPGTTLTPGPQSVLSLHPQNSVLTVHTFSPRGFRSAQLTLSPLLCCDA